MPRATTTEITPFRTKRCWKKYRNGKVHYVGQGQVKPKGTSPWDDGRYTGKRTDCPYYQQALEEWKLIRRKLDSDEANGVDTGTPHYQQHLKRWRKQVADLQRNPNIVSTLSLNDLLRGDEPSPEQQAGNGHMQTTLPDSSMAHAYHKPPPSFDLSKPEISCSDIPGLIEAYLADQRLMAESGQFSKAHYGEMREKLTYFQEYADDCNLSDIGEIDAKRLKHFHKVQLYCLAHPEEKAWVSFSTVKKRLNCVKNFLLWCEDGRAYQSPGYLLKFNKVKPPRIDSDVESNGSGNPVFSPAEIRELWNLATQRTRLYLLLGLNCGFTQVDISSLHWSHYDKEAGVINRLRNKTKHHERSVRQVFELWPETKCLLEKFAKPISSGLMLRTDKDNELLTRQINDDGSYTKSDSINMAIQRLRTQWFKRQIFANHPELAGRQISKTATEEKNGRVASMLRQKRQSDNRGFKILRKSAANELENSAEHKELVSLFLAHSERATKRFYVNPDYDALIPATKYLRGVYGLKL